MKNKSLLIIGVLLFVSLACAFVSNALQPNSNTSILSTPMANISTSAIAETNIPKFAPIPRPAGLLGGGGLIVYYDDKDSATIFTNPDGSGKPSISWDVYGFSLSWSSNGQTLIGPLGPSTSSIYRIRSDGTDYAQVTDATQVEDPNMQISQLTNYQISPDGKYIAYSYTSQTSAISKCAIISIDGSNRQLVSAVNCAYDWSPDSSRLVLSASEDPAHYSQLFIFDLKRDNLTPLTPKVQGQFDSGARWLPDGSAIFFWRKQVISTINSTIDNYLIDPYGNDMRKCGFTCQVWSPDASRLAYVDGGFQLYIANSNNSNSTEISHLDGMVWGIYWSPDGKYLAFNLKDRSTGDNDVYVISADGKEYWPIANNAKDDENVIGWRP